MKRVLTAVVLIPIVLVVVFKAPLWVFAAVSGLFAVLAAHEYLAIARKYDANVPRLPGLALVGLSFALAAWGQFGGNRSEVVSFLIFAIPLYPILLLGWGLTLSEMKSALLSAALGAFLVPYVLLPLLSLVVIRAMPHGWFYVLWLFLMVWSGDIFAYYVGKNFGKRLLAPSVSPKKTWEGTTASLLGSAIVSMILTSFAYRLEGWMNTNNLLAQSRDGGFSPETTIPLWVAASVAIVINVLAQIGDLAESALKRGAGVKDSGNILPGHGGILDRIDALLFAAPAALLIFLILNSFLPYSATFD